ncbi:Periplasmic dipeptide transport protein [Geodia barretti]|uniref:Periplasmic dipeptide transport protein n=1 Tax=Geodia barretti TaxID=519541 RepID=A0AA35R0J0_GEOBA|nr:Periplasmic dipeptide transport protein [Geodia barretti]
MSRGLALRTGIVGLLALAVTAAMACGAPAEQEPATSAPAAARQQPAATQAAAPVQQAAPTATTALAQPAGMSDRAAGGAAPTVAPAATAVPDATAGEPVQADLRVAITPPYAENLLGWRVGGTNQGILQPMQEALFQRDYQTWEAKPMLAESWSVSPDGRQWTIKLRENVPFHHEADTFGVSDFVFSFQLWSHAEAKTGFGDFWHQILGPDGERRNWTADELGTAPTVTEVSDNEMVWNMKRPELWIPFYASDATTDPLIYSLDYWATNGEAAYAANPVGTGPWRHVSYEQGAKLEYERAFDDHWRINPDFDTLTFFFAEEDLTRVAMLRAGEADIAEIPRELQGEIVKAGYAITKSTLPAFMVWIGIGGQYLEDRRDANDPNTNVLVRRAMNHAMNRDALNEAFFDNKMELMANTGWHPTDPSFDPAWEIPAYDPDLSRQLLQEAGYSEGSGPSVEFMAGKLVGVPELTEVAVPMISWLEEVGFTVDAQIGEFQPIRTRYKAREMNGVLWTHRTGFWPAGRNMRVYFVSPTLAGAVYMYEDPYTEDLFSKWQSSVDDEERLNLMKDAGQYMYEQNATIPLGFLFAEFGINPNVIAEYSVNNSYFGGMKGHEYTKVVRN